MNSDYIWACALGALVIAWFSWDQLNRPTEEGARKLARLYDLLTPEELSGRGTFFGAYLFYLCMLLMIYAVLCAAATFGLAVGPLQDFFGTAEQPKPEAPLMVAAAMVGLLPNSRSRWFTSTERRLRVLAHSAVGIPGAYIGVKTRLERARLELSDLPEGVIEPLERRRLDERMRCAEFALEPGSFALGQLRRALVKIAAFRAWVLQQRVWPDPIHREAYRRLEETVVKQAAALEVELDMLVAATRQIERGPEEAHEVVRLLGVESRGDASRGEAWRGGLTDRWRAAAAQAEEAQNDFCALLAVYTVRQPVVPAGDPARSALAAFLDRAREEEGPQEFDRQLVLWAGVAALTVAFLGGAFDGVLSGARSTLLGDGTAWAVGAFVNYAPAMLIALLMREARVETRPAGERLSATRYALIVVIAGLVTWILLTLLNLSQAAMSAGIARLSANFSAATAYALQSEAAPAIRGGAMAFAVLVALEAARADPASPRVRRWRRVGPVGLALVFAASAAAYQYDAYVIRLDAWENRRAETAESQAEIARRRHARAAPEPVEAAPAEREAWAAAQAAAAEAARTRALETFAALNPPPRPDYLRAGFSVALTAAIGLVSGIALFRAAAPPPRAAAGPRLRRVA